MIHLMIDVIVRHQLTAFPSSVNWFSPRFANCLMTYLFLAFISKV